jgi:cbb3-type cytochrome oxidase cytochrome c subunit
MTVPQKKYQTVEGKKWHLRKMTAPQKIVPNSWRKKIVLEKNDSAKKNTKQLKINPKEKMAPDKMTAPKNRKLKVKNGTLEKWQGPKKPTKKLKIKTATGKISNPDCETEGGID